MKSREHPTVYESGTPFDPNRIRAAAIYCSDGRFGDQFDDFLHNALGLPRYDRLAVPGGAACLAGHFPIYHEREGLIEQLRFLVKVHGLERVVLIAHQDCAFYTEWLRITPLQLERQQRIDIKAAAEQVRSVDYNLRIDSFFARKNPNGRVEFQSFV